MRVILLEIDEDQGARDDIFFWGGWSEQFIKCSREDFETTDSIIKITSRGKHGKANRVDLLCLSSYELE